MGHPDLHFGNKGFITNCSKDWRADTFQLSALWDSSFTEDSCLFKIILLWCEGLCMGERAGNLCLITSQWIPGKAFISSFQFGTTQKSHVTFRAPYELAKDFIWLHHRPNFSFISIFAFVLFLLLVWPQEPSLLDLQFTTFHLSIFCVDPNL